MQLTKKDYQYLYEKTKDATPIHQDCGLLCGSICCQPNRKNSLGVYLYPGEEVLFQGDAPWFSRECHDPAQYGFPVNWVSPVHFIKCKGLCPREDRPLACRFFPLTPHLLTDGTLLLLYETIQLPYQCPLIQKKTPLQKEFIEVVALAWQILLKDSRMVSLVQEDSREREIQWSSIPTILWSTASR